MNSSEFQAQTEQIGQLVERATNLPDEDARTTALELLQSIMDLYGAGISRIVEVLGDSGETGRASLAKLASDPLVCGLLVLHGIHPVALEQRVARAIEKVRPQLHKQSGSVDLLGIDDAVVRLKINSAGHGCGSSREALQDVVEQAIREAAPDVVEIVVEGAPASGFVPLNMIQPAMKEEGNYEKSTA